MNDKPEIKDENNGRRAMVTTEGSWILWRFEFDADDGRGVAWQHGRSMGPEESVENSIRHFTDEGYTVIEWRDV